MVADVLDSIDPRLCVSCKAARALCGISPCPLLARIQHHMPKIQVKGRDLFGSSPPSLFVGRHGYPAVSVGPMLPPEHREDGAAHLLDDPRSWLAMSIPDVVGMRSSLVRTTHKVSVRGAAQAPDRITRLSQELALAARPVDTEVRLTRIPSFGAPQVGEFSAPHGPTVGLERAVLAENPRVERRVEAVTSDTDLRAGAGLWDLYRDGTDRYQLERILSAGLLGQKAQRRLVPTRWAITATDDAVGKQLIDRVRDLPTIDKPTIHAGQRFGNRFHVLLLPRSWGFDNIEVWLKGSFWAGAGGSGASWAGVVPAEDWEDHRGRTAYAENTTGGYYATRLSVLEHLVGIGRQATAVVLREITDEYTTPLGVWVVRETCKLALDRPGLVFEDLPSALRHMDRRAHFKPWQAHASLLDRLRRQTTLDAY